MDAKGYFDLLCRTSREGGFPSVSTCFDGCAYRGRDGRKCAVGLLIPGEKYTPGIEGTKASNANTRMLYELPVGMTLVEIDMVQAAHDARGNVNCEWDHADFVRQLRRIPCFAGFTDPTAAQEG